MDKQYSVKFFTSFVEAMQRLCREYLDFEQGVELSGYLAVEIDNYKKERYVLSELVQSTGNVISESYCTKAFKTLRKEIPLKVSRENEHITPKKTYGLHVVNRVHRPPRPAEVTIDLRDSPEREIPPSPLRYQQSPSSRGQPLNSPSRWQNRNQTTPNRMNHRFPSSVGSSPRMRTMGALRSPNPPRIMTTHPSNRMQPGQQMNRMQPGQQMNRMPSGLQPNQMQTGHQMNQTQTGHQMQTGQQMNQMQTAQPLNQIQDPQPANQIQPRRPEQSPTHQTWTPPRITSVQSLSSPQHEPLVIPSSPQPSPAPVTAGQKRPSESSESVASPASKKDKIDENLEALIDLANMAKELSSDSQTETKSDSSTVISSATVTTLPSAVTSPSTSSSQSVQPVPTETVPTESIRMPLPAEVKVKKENESSDPCLIIDNANDGEVSLGSDSAFNNNPSVETFTPLNIANSGSFPGDTASTSFDSATVQNETLNSETYEVGGATSDEYRTNKLACQFCGKTFGFSSTLQRHMLHFHISHNKLTCPICWKSFNRRDSLTLHIKGHNANFRCSLCLKSFHYKSSLVTHMKQHGDYA